MRTLKQPREIATGSPERRFALLARRRHGPPNGRQAR